MEALKVNEDIRVFVAFDNGNVFPVWFLWRNRYYKIKDVTYTWTSNLGLAKLRHYSVTDGTNTYELCFNSESLEWVLGRVCTE
jgi:hypothetical protein